MEIALHTKIKHRILAYYYGIIRQMFQDKDKAPFSWYYVDLFCGDGNCVCKDIEPHILSLLPDKNDVEYPAPFFSLFDYASPANFPLSCYFNDKDNEKIEQLKQRLEPYNQFVKDVDNKDANIHYKKILSLIGTPNKPGFFLLDPEHHDDLKFSTIKAISEFKNEKGRKPELIINLMIYTMLLALKRGNEKDLQLITDSLGTDSWKNEYSKYKEKNKTHELFRDIFIEQLKSLGYQVTYYEIKSVGQAPLYYLIFAAFNDRIYAFHKKMEPYIMELGKEKWVKEVASINYLIQKVPISQKTLNVAV